MPSHLKPAPRRGDKASQEKEKCGARNESTRGETASSFTKSFGTQVFHQAPRPASLHSAHVRPQRSTGQPWTHGPQADVFHLHVSPSKQIMAEWKPLRPERATLCLPLSSPAHPGIHGLLPPPIQNSESPGLEGNNPRVSSPAAPTPCTLGRENHKGRQPGPQRGLQFPNEAGSKWAGRRQQGRG